MSVASPIAIPIDRIIIGERIRKDIGDVAGLAASIEQVGLLHPIVVTPDSKLVAGERRIRAFELLGRRDIPATIIDLDQIARGEYAENVERKDFTWTEAVSIKRAIQPLERAAAKERQREHGGTAPGKQSRQIAGSVGGDARDRVARAVGKKARTLAKAEEVVKAVEADPEKFGHLLEEMDDTGNVDRAFQQVRAERDREEALLKREAGSIVGGTLADLERLAASGKRFGAVLADVPWPFATWSHCGLAGDHTQEHRAERSRAAPYKTMSHEDIYAVPVEALASKDCALFFWVVQTQLPQALETIRRWGFEFTSVAFAWVKADDAENIQVPMGCGYWTRAGFEQCWIATRGNPRRLHADVRQVIVEPRREHSRKPDCVHERIERLVGGPYLELFARRERAGWTTWGNEVPPPGEYDAADDFAKCLEVGYAAIRERVANGGPGWTPPGPVEPTAEKADDGLDIPEFLRRSRRPTAGGAA